MKNILKSTLISPFVLLVLLFGCKDDTVTPPVVVIDTGTADFTRFVSIGNSLTAGFQSNALSQRDQTYSFPNLLSQQVRTPFVQPLMKDPGIGSRIRLLNLAPTLVNETGVNPFDPASDINYQLARPFNNLGIPGAVLYDMMDTTGASSDFVSKSISRQNPFFSHVLRTHFFGNSVFQQARNLAPTFISVWIGNNDVLGYATSGGVSGTNVGPPYSADPPRTKPTETILFNAWYTQLMDSLKATGAGIVTANIADVTTIPFFTTLGPQIRAKLPPGIVFRYQRNGNRGPSNPVTDTTTFSGAPGDPLVTLPGIAYAGLIGHPTGKWYSDNNISPLPPGIDTTKPFALHPQNPWPDALTLDEGERTIAQTTIAAYNAIIDSVAGNRGIGVADVHATLITASTTGIFVPGVGTFSPAFIVGGLFSYDGVHPSSRGNALIANIWIDVVNQKFNASIPHVAVASVPGIPIGKVSASLPNYDDVSWKGFIDLMNGGRW
ncbi:MAG TPA: hypothetical protein VL633_06470 [Bacteroidota bacterium]|jgi:hypothetical protein|nr:hypothetical protein [Bacteroidota bacterium]